MAQKLLGLVELPSGVSMRLSRLPPLHRPERSVARTRFNRTRGLDGPHNRVRMPPCLMDKPLSVLGDTSMPFLQPPLPLPPSPGSAISAGLFVPMRCFSSRPILPDNSSSSGRTAESPSPAQPASAPPLPPTPVTAEEAQLRLTGRPAASVASPSETSDRLPGSLSAAYLQARPDRWHCEQGHRRSQRSLRLRHSVHDLTGRGRLTLRDGCDGCCCCCLCCWWWYVLVCGRWCAGGRGGGGGG